MDNKKRFSIILIFLFCLGIIPGFNTVLHFTPAMEQTSKNSQISVKTIEMGTTGFDCDDFSMAVFKVYESVRDFSFTFSSSTLYYRLYFGVMFTGSDFTHVTLQIYAFITTLDENYVTSLSITLHYNLTGAFQGILINESGSKSDSAPFMTSDPCLYEYPLYSAIVNKNLLPETLTISFEYRLTCAEFSDKTGTYIKSASLSPYPTLDFILLMVIIIGGVVGTILTIWLVKRYRRKKFYQGAYDHWV